MRISDWSSDVCSSDLGSRRFQWKRYAPAILTAFLPMLLSLVIYFTYEEKGSPVHVVVVQPNMDPYGEKYDGLYEQDQLRQLITLSDSLGQDRKSVVSGKRVSVRVDLGGLRILTQTTKTKNN